MTIVKNSKEEGGIEAAPMENEWEVIIGEWVHGIDTYTVEKLKVCMFIGS